jgi:hypothetical protein
MSISESDRAFLAGFLEGEAHLAVREQNGGSSFGCGVYVRLRDDDQDLLEWLVALTGLGRLRRVPEQPTSRPQISWTVESQADCTALLRLIGGCGFHGRRSAELRLWTEAVDLWTSGTAAKRRAGLPQIARDLQAARKYGGGARTARPLSAGEHERVGYITGLVCAEGCFQMARDRPRFSMHLRADDRPLLELLRTTTGFGAVYSHSPAPPLNPSSTWVVAARAELEQLLALLQRGELPGRKQAEMETWAVAVHELCSAARLGVRPRPALLTLACARLRAARTYRRSTRELLELPGRDVRAEALAALHAWSEDSGGRLACGGYERWRREHPGAPTRNTVAKVFGSWRAAMEAAGLGDRAARQVTRRVGGEDARRRRREAQRARVVDAVRRFEAEHGRLPRAMEFFKWRLTVIPDTPTQATVYNLFPGVGKLYWRPVRRREVRAMRRISSGVHAEPVATTVRPGCHKGARPRPGAAVRAGRPCR